MRASNTQVHRPLALSWPTIMARHIWPIPSGPPKAKACGILKSSFPMIRRATRLVWACRTGGPAAARNKALALAHGEWVAIMDSDDFMHPERLTKLVEVARHDNADIVADNLVEFDTNGSKSLRPLLAGR